MKASYGTSPRLNAPLTRPRIKDPKNWDELRLEENYLADLRVILKRGKAFKRGFERRLAKERVILGSDRSDRDARFRTNCLRRIGSFKECIDNLDAILKAISKSIKL